VQENAEYNWENKMKVDIMQLEFIDKTLRIIANEIDILCEEERTVTSLFRMVDPGVHGQLPLRGIDLRQRKHDEGLGTKILASVNEKWQYDPKRPEIMCAKIHGVGLHRHIHLQTHPNTVLR